MGIYNFKGETYLAFVDISGFKHMMKNKDRIAKVVYEFYNCGYNALDTYRYGDRRQYAGIQGIFVSDCGILFVNKDHEGELMESKRDSLNQVLNVIKEINKGMIHNNVILTTSIAYGSLDCSEKLEFNGISKNPFYGDVYINAFMDNENPQIKIKPGECRVVRENLPENLITDESQNIYENFNLLRKKKKDHYYFYWMLNNKSQITNFNNKYLDLENEKYKKTIELIKKYTTNSINE